MHLSKYFLIQAIPKATFQVWGKKNLSLDSFFEDKKFSGISIDSRTVTQGEIFLAIKGENFDGHDFLQEALQNGSSAFIVRHDKKDSFKKIPKDLLDGKLIIFVEDTLQALMEIAKNWRHRFLFPIIAITGSIGKTSTKKMVETILSCAKFPAFVSFKNQNNIIGLCLNVLKLDTHQKAGIFELGISHKGEMEQLADVLRPDVALITKISHSHVHGLGTLAEVATQKKMVFKFFQSSNIAIVNGDQPLLINTYYNHPLIKFGLKTKNHIQARKIKFIKQKNGDLATNFILKIYSKKYSLTLNGNHPSLVNNALAATCITNFLNISAENIITGLQKFEGCEGRFEKKQINKTGQGIIISDCYNASPESMKAAILAFGQLDNQGPKIAIIGDMLELGEKELFWHRQIGRTLRKASKIDYLILVGNRAKIIAKTAPAKLKIDCVLDWQEATNKLENLLKNHSKKHSLVLVKASRAVSLDKLVKVFSL